MPTRAERKAELSEIHDKLAVLSNRERQVLDGLVAGNANKTIAFDLGIGLRTVEIYRANLMTKMGAQPVRSGAHGDDGAPEKLRQTRGAIRVVLPIRRP